jgi:hypothetical protein
MKQTLAKIIERAVEQQQSARSPDQSTDIYKTMRTKSGFTYVPRSIYFTFVGAQQ